ncbi:MAG: DNA-binding response regulator, partial [Draconibacterium sp.]|nr:DNA-binding response regulator [Draconibacterium sp.]
LTKREKEITKKITEEMSNQQIADNLNISLRTVETHRRNIMQKLNVKNAVSLVKYAIKNNLISFD